MTAFGRGLLCTGTPVGSTVWTFGNVQNQPSFGQVTREVSTHVGNVAGAALTITLDYVYDARARVSRIETSLNEGNGQFVRNYTERFTFDQFGRPFQSFDASGDSRGARYLYNSRGYLERVREAREGAQGQVYWTLTHQDARGNATRAVLGNGMELLRTFNAVTGEPENLLDSVGAQVAQNTQLIWDQISRLQERHDLSNSHQERFFYDGRNRLTRVEARPGNGSWSVQQRLRYDVSGNILCKSDVPGSSLSCASSSHQNYNYGSSRPHAVTQAGNRTFTYDNNGNVVEDRVNGSVDRRFVYTSFDLLRRVSRGSRHTEFHYGANRARMLRRELSGTTVTERVHYIGSTEVIWPGANPSTQQASFRRDVAGVALVTMAPNGQTQIRYPHRDHLGSVVAMSNAFGQVEARMGFDAWGARRDVQTPSQRWLQWLSPIAPAWAGPMLDITPQGYTGHEHVDDHGIIHMNGRIYDPLLARFLQADPFIEDTGTLNRYTYVHNNPLIYTDPSGYFSFRKWARTALSIGVAVASGWGVAYLLKQKLTGWAFMAAVAGGAASGGIATGTMEGVMWGAFSGAVFFGVGQAFGGSAANGSGLWGSSFKNGRELARATLAHGVAGGTISHLQGGKFGHGFVSAGVSKSFSTRIAGAFDGNALAQGTATALVGGTTSRLTGGRFANGAVTAAMAFAFNQMQGYREARARGRSLLLGEDESEVILSRKVIRHRLGLLAKELDSTIAHLRSISENPQAIADFFGYSYSPRDDIWLGSAADKQRQLLVLVRANIAVRGGSENMAALGRAAIEAGLTKGGGTALRRAGIVSNLSAYHPDLISRPVMQRAPSISCASVSQCGVEWR